MRLKSFLSLTCGLALAAALSAAVASAAPHVIELAPAVGEAERADVARGVFYSRTHELTIPVGEVLLSSSPDGAGELCTDDQATLTFRRPGRPPQEWSRLFADPASETIACAPPQRLRLEAGPGRYQVEVTLSDHFPFTYSSRPYFLITLAGESEPIRPAPAAVALATVPVATPTSAITPTPAATSTTAPAAATPAGAAVAAGGPVAAPPQAGATGWRLPAVLAILAATVAAVAIAALSRRRPLARGPSLRGIVDLFDRRTGERRTTLLQRFPHGAALLRAPLDLVAADAVAVGGRLVAQIVPGEAGPQLRVEGPEPTVPTPLRDGETVLIDRAVELRYRGAPAAYPKSTITRRRR